jgi:hypothetical protein
MKHKILLVYPTVNTNVFDTLVFSSLKETNALNKITIKPLQNSVGIGLPKLYNEFLTKEYTELYDYVVFCHDDITIQDHYWIEKLEKQFSKGYGVVGLAGTKQCVIKDKNLWHLMNNVKPFHDASGRVGHYKEEDPAKGYFWSNFGPTPQRVILLDGLFLAVDLKLAVERELKFDENNPARFHHYDLDFSLSANSKKIKLTTCDISVIHKSHGLKSLDHPEWNAGNGWFKQKYK